MKILVADDDRVISHLLCTLLQQEGHAAVAAYDAMQTLMFAMRPPVPALVVLDINMPGGTGIEALRKLKRSARTAAIPVIVVSGSGDEAMPQAVRDLGAADVLLKPIDGDAFLDAVRRVLTPTAA
ncbi:MAG: response regulator [Gemmatimonadales bacterium]